MNILALLYRHQSQYQSKKKCEKKKICFFFLIKSNNLMLALTYLTKKKTQHND
jgi:hypothetical protein